MKLLFLIYFRILKQSTDSLLLPKVLEGLARFAHLINVDFFEDLLNVLKQISAQQNSDYIHNKNTNLSAPVCALHCIIAAFELMDTLGQSLKVDLQDFYSGMYMHMIRLSSRPGNAESFARGRNEVELLLSGIDSLLKRNREIPIARVSSFVKRLSILALNSPSNAALAYMSSIKSALKRFPMIGRLVEDDGRVATGMYDALMDDPDMCNPFATSLYELSLLNVTLF